MNKYTKVTHAQVLKKVPLTRHKYGQAAKKSTIEPTTQYMMPLIYKYVIILMENSAGIIIELFYFLHCS